MSQNILLYNSKRYNNNENKLKYSRYDLNNNQLQDDIKDDKEPNRLSRSLNSIKEESPNQIIKEKNDNKYNNLYEELFNFGENKKNKIDLYNSVDNIILDDKKPKGLNNIGATCYMNATLQCFYHCKKLTNYLVSKKYINEDKIVVKNNSVTSAYINLVNKLYMKDGIQSLSPVEFKEILGRENPLFRGIAANDSKDLILFLEQVLTKELTLPEEKKNIYDGALVPYVTLDQTDENNVLQIFLKDFIKEKSIIKDIFYFITKTTTVCQGCNNIIYNFQLSNFLIFPLEKTYNDYNSKNNLFNNNMNNLLSMMNLYMNMNTNMISTSNMSTNMNNSMNNKMNNYNNNNNLYNQNQNNNKIYNNNFTQNFFNNYNNNLIF